MYKEFYLMNKDKKVLKLSSEPEKYGDAILKEVERYGELPMGFTSISEWVRSRQAPKHRKHIQRLLIQNGCANLAGFMETSYVLSLNDTFWVRPASDERTWDEVSLYRNPFNEILASIAFDGIPSNQTFSSTSPELSTDGAYAKCWIREHDDIYLIKKGHDKNGHQGLEPYSEFYASQLAKKFCKQRVVEYDLVEHKGEIVSKCKLFTDEEQGFLPIWKFPDRCNYVSDFEALYSQYGCLDEFRRMLVFDALVFNIDRHQGNHGFYIDNATQKIITVAPLFDHNQTLLPTTEDEELFDGDIDRILYTKTPKIGIDFVETAHKLLTPDIKGDLLKLRGFTFTKHAKYNLEDRRLHILEEIIEKQIDRIIGNVKIPICF